MKAPDKIYIQDGLPNIYGVNQDSGIRGMHEYIRKDALLEWAKKKNMRIDAEEGDYSLGYVSAMIDLIDKIKSL